MSSLLVVFYIIVFQYMVIEYLRSIREEKVYKEQYLGMVADSYDHLITYSDIDELKKMDENSLKLIYGAVLLEWGNLTMEVVALNEKLIFLARLFKISIVVAIVVLAAIYI